MFDEVIEVTNRSAANDYMILQYENKVNMDKKCNSSLCLYHLLYTVVLMLLFTVLVE